METENTHPLYSPLLLLLYPIDQQSFQHHWDDFKYSFKIGGVRKKLALCLEACLSSTDDHFNDPINRSNMMFFMARLMVLIEALYMEEMNKDDRFRQFNQKAE